MAASSKWHATAVMRPSPRLSNRLATAVDELHPAWIIPFIQAAKLDDVQRVRELLDADWSLIDYGPTVVLGTKLMEEGGT
jgi:hypothetical protein